MSDSSLGQPHAASNEGDTGFCERFGQLVAVLNISQNEFARQLGSTSAFISNLARGKSKPGLEFLQKIAETFGVSLDWLVLGKGTLRGDQYLDPEWHHAVQLRVTLANLVASGDQEARMLASELLGETFISNQTSPARQGLLDQLAKSAEHSSLVCMLYNRYVPIGDTLQRSKDVLRAAIQQLQASGNDPLAAMVNQSKQASQSTPPAQQTQVGACNRQAGRDYHER